MAKEVILVPKETYLKLLESHKDKFQDHRNADGDSVKKRKISALNDIDTEIENTQEIHPITAKQNEDIYMDVDSVREKQGDKLKGDNIEVEHYESMGNHDGLLADQNELGHVDTNYVKKKSNNQSAKKDKLIQSDSSTDVTAKLGVYKTSADIIKRKRKSPVERRNFMKKREKKWLKYA